LQGNHAIFLTNGKRDLDYYIWEVSKDYEFCTYSNGQGNVQY